MPTFQQGHNSYQYSGNSSGFQSSEQYSVSNNEQLIAIGPLLGILWQRKSLIALFIALFVGLAVLYVTITPKTYTAKGVIVIDPLQVRVLNSEAALSGIGANSAAIASQVEIIQSRTLVYKVFIEQGYVEDPEFSKTRFLSKIFGIFSTPSPVTETKIFNNFWNRLDVERQGLTYVIDVSFTSQSAQKSAQVVNEIIATYMGNQIDEKSGANAEVSILLNAQMEGLRAELSAKEAAVEDYKEAHNILNVGSGRTLLESQIEQLSAQLVVARERARAANNRHLQVGSVNATTDSLTSLFEILTDSSPTSLRANYTQSSMELSSLQASLGPRHPNLLVAAAELARLENLIRNEAQTVLIQIKSEKDLAQTNVENAESELVALRAQNSQSNQNQVELRNLERQAGATRQVLEQFVSREQETGQLENLQRSDARVISEAVAPIIATWPKSTLLLAIAGFFGIALGSALALYLGPKTSHVKARQPNDVQEIPDEHQAVFHATGHDAYVDNYQPQSYQADPYPEHTQTHSNFAYAPSSENAGPIYHSSELPGELSNELPVEDQNAYYGARNNIQSEHAKNQTQAGTAQFTRDQPVKNAQTQVPPRVWARRAAGEPYSAPNATSTKATPNPAQQTGIRQPQNVRNNPMSAANIRSSSGLTREGFVSELKRRLERNAQR